MKERWQRQEQHIAKSLNGRVQPASGAGRNHKGDVRTSQFLVECKATDKDSISLKKAWIQKISKQACSIARDPLIHLDINGERCYVVPERVWNYLYGRIDHVTGNTSSVDTDTVSEKCENPLGMQQLQQPRMREQQKRDRQLQGNRQATQHVVRFTQRCTRRQGS